nr:hypothetical protein [Sphingomonas mali]
MDGDLSEIGFRPISSLGLPIAEHLADLGLHRIDIEIADRHDRRTRRPVIGVVEFDEAVAWRRVDDLHVTDREAISDLLSFCQNVKLLLRDAQRRRIAQPLLATDHAALVNDIVLVHRRFGHLLPQDMQAGIDRQIVGARQFELIERLIETRGGVEIGPEGETQPFEDRDQIIFGNMRRSIERHMFHEMGEPELILFLHQRAGVDPDTQRCLTRGRGVVQDGEPHAVRKSPEPYGAVSGHVACRLSPWPGRGLSRRFDLRGHAPRRSGPARCRGHGKETGRGNGNHQQQSTR